MRRTIKAGMRWAAAELLQATAAIQPFPGVAPQRISNVLSYLSWAPVMALFFGGGIFFYSHRVDGCQVRPSDGSC